MSKRPVRVTLSMTADDYDRLCWLAFYWEENPSTTGNAVLQEAIASKIAASPLLQKGYADHRKRKADQDKSKSKEREKHNAATRPASEQTC